jgi:hypothetical protein
MAILVRRYQTHSSGFDLPFADNGIEFESSDATDEPADLVEGL